MLGAPYAERTGVRYVYGIEPMDAMTNAEGHLLVDFQLGANGVPVFELAPEKRPNDFGLIFSMLWSRSLSPWTTIGESLFYAEGDDMLCRPPVDAGDEPRMFFKYRIVLPGYESPVEDPVAESVDIAVECIWHDSGNSQGKRPSSVVMTLYVGQEPVTKVTLNEGNGWTATVNDLPTVVNGQPAQYTWSEENVPGYEQEGVPQQGNLTIFIYKILGLTLPDPTPDLPGGGGNDPNPWDDPYPGEDPDPGEGPL